MGKKHGDKKKKSKIVLSLAEFNEDAGIGGVDPELSALPSAPKPAEEWEAQGGRPEYNSRGYKERQPRNYDNVGDFEDRDWTRKGPVEAPERNGFGAGADRDWSDMRRGPMDAPDGQQPERNWNDMRRGPVDSAYSGAVERDWTARKGPVEAESGSAPRVIADESWNSRKGPVEAEFPNAAVPANRDWSVRKGPVEAEASTSKEEADWTARKGPVESEFASGEGETAERDWSQRKGPVEANPAPGQQTEADWSSARKGPIEAETPRPDVAERDWSARRSPVETEVESAQKAVRDIDFGDVRRGAKLEEMKAIEQEKAKAGPVEVAARPEIEKEAWRRDSIGIVGRRGLMEARASEQPVRVSERPASTGHDSVPKERDWGAARRTEGLRANPRPSRPNFRKSDASEATDVAGIEDADKITTPTSANTADDDDWTTVRSGGQKRSGFGSGRRHSGRDGRGGFQRRGGSGNRDSESEKAMRSPINAENKATSSPVTPVASAVSES